MLLSQHLPVNSERLLQVGAGLQVSSLILQQYGQIIEDGNGGRMLRSQHSLVDLG